MAKTKKRKPNTRPHTEGLCVLPRIVPHRVEDLEPLLQPHVLPNEVTGCWEWIGAKANGYGRVKRGGRVHQVTRYVYEALVGPIEEGLQIDHLCRFRACVNPAHLEVITQEENILRGTGITARNAQKTHCRNGHEFNAENTGSRGQRRGGRECLACKRERQARYRAAQRQEASA